jgi:predicted xylose isomerase-like sugar epimerase
MSPTPFIPLARARCRAALVARCAGAAIVGVAELGAMVAVREHAKGEEARATRLAREVAASGATALVGREIHDDGLIGHTRNYNDAIAGVK